jgi:autoinducer 2-degrading protein
MHVVTVAFQVRAAHLQDFLREINQNAKSSLELESGCRYFDVCVSPKDAGKVFLYELYDDRQAFDRHLASEHFQAFNRLTADWIETKEVQEFIRK